MWVGRSCRVGAYPVVEAQGLIFVYATRTSELEVRHLRDDEHGCVMSHP